jgi:hypothetical protein
MNRKKILSATVFALLLAISINAQDEVIFPDDMPNRFSSEKELKEKVQFFAKEWQSYTVSGRDYIIGRIVIFETGSTMQRITCWRKSSSGMVTCVWNVRLFQPVKIDFNKQTSQLSVTATANTPEQGKVLASVLLSALH